MYDATVNDDFMMPSLNNNFVYDHMNTATGEPQCVQFSIVNDNIIEANETFSIQLRQVPFVTFSERLTTIMIQDDDCKPE